MIKHFKIPCFMALSLFLSCCSSASSDNQAHVNFVQQQLASAKTQCEEAMNDPQLDGIRTKIALMGNPSNEMMVNKGFVQGADRPEILVWKNKRLRCREELNAIYESANLPPEEYTIITSAQQNMDVAINKLYSGDITYGDFAIDQSSIGNLADANLANVDRDYSAKNRQYAEQASHQQNAAIWDAVAKAAGGTADALNQQQQQQAYNRQQAELTSVLTAPRYANCYTSGGQTSCYGN